jgi:CheY-like chemotaxis protein
MNTGTVLHPRVLVVDHDESVLALLEQTLHLEHYRTDVATTLEDACQKADSELYDLVLSDLFSGFPPRLVTVQRLQQRSHPTPVGILSGWPIEPTEAAHAGFAFVLHKPFDLDHLLERIVSHLTPVLSPLERERSEHISACVSALNDRRWDALRALLAPEVAYVPLTSPLTTARAILGQEDVFAHAQQVLTVLPDVHTDYRLLLPHPERPMIRFRCSWQGPNGQRQHLAGMALFRFRGERISQIGFNMNTRRLRELLEPGQYETLC